jgi:hypothetical protein
MTAAAPTASMPAAQGHGTAGRGPVGGKGAAGTVAGATRTGGAVVVGATVVVGGTVQFWPHESTGPAMRPAASPGAVCTAFMSNWPHFASTNSWLGPCSRSRSSSP